MITRPVTNITQTTAECGGNILTDGGKKIIERGICWSTKQNPDVYNNRTSDGNSDGTFTSSISGLIANTTYYIRAYAKNANEISYGDQLSFTTSPNVTIIPSVSTSAIIDITQTTAISGGNITSDGGSSVIERGVCWSSIPNPTILNSKTSDGRDTGRFISNIKGLTANTGYYVRAYATNANGTAYGNQLIFLSGKSITQPNITTTSVSNISQTTAASGGNVTSDGGASVTAHGVCWSLIQNPTIANDKTNDGSGTGSFASSITGLISGTTYYVRAYATNINGTVYGNMLVFTTSRAPALPVLTTSKITNITEINATSGGVILSDGGAAITARGVCWSTSQNPTINNNKSSDGSGAGAFNSSITGLTLNTTYYVRAYATNSDVTGYGNQLIFTANAPSQFTIGQLYGGGIVFYIDSNGLHGLIAASNDLSEGAIWGCYGTLLQGTDGKTVGTGKNNTANIITDCSTVGIAARLCYNSGLNGYNDWFLPSQDELNLLYLQKDIIGGFKGSYYWSSTQKDNNEAWEQNFITGQIYNYGKYDPVSVRAIRAF